MTPPLKVPPSTRTEKRTQATPERTRPVHFVLCAKNWRFLSRAVYINAKFKFLKTNRTLFGREFKGSRKRVLEF